MKIMNKKNKNKTTKKKSGSVKLLLKALFQKILALAFGPEQPLLVGGAHGKTVIQFILKLCHIAHNSTPDRPLLFFLFLSTHSAGENVDSVINSSCAHIHIWSHSIHKNSMWSFPGINVPPRRLLWRRDCKQHHIWCDKCSNIWNAAISSSTLVLFSVSGGVSGWGWTSSDF